jgi:hypothetical protein
VTHNDITDGHYGGHPPPARSGQSASGPFAPVPAAHGTLVASRKRTLDQHARSTGMGHNRTLVSLSLSRTAIRCASHTGSNEILITGRRRPTPCRRVFSLTTDNTWPPATSSARFSSKCRPYASTRGEGPALLQPGASSGSRHFGKFHARTACIRPKGNISGTRSATRRFRPRFYCATSCSPPQADIFASCSTVSVAQTPLSLSP